MVKRNGGNHMKPSGIGSKIRQSMQACFYLSFAIMGLYVASESIVSEDFGMLLVMLYWGLMVAAFVLSIISLVKFREKAYAITILVISSIINAFFFTGFIAGALMIIMGE
jgi:hypothetical protein